MQKKERKKNMLTCLTCLRAFVSMLRSCLHFLLALRAFTLFACLNFFMHFTCLHFFTCLMCLHFFTCLTYFQFFMWLNYLHFLCAFIFFTCLHFFYMLYVAWFFYVHSILNCLTCLLFLRACVLFMYMPRKLTRINELTYDCSTSLLLNSVIYQRLYSTWFFPFLKWKMLITFNPFVSNAPFLYPLKTSENRKVLWCFQGVKKGCIGNKWVKILCYF